MRSPSSGARAPRAALWAFAGVSLIAGALAFFAARPIASQQEDSTARLAATLAAVSAPNLPALPPADSFTVGDRSVAAGSRVDGTVAARDGSVHVFGVVAGDVVTVRGHIVLHDGAQVDGNAIAIDGTVRLEGGHVNGQTLQLAGAAAAAPPESGGARIADQVMLVAGWLTMLLIISAGVLMLASDNLMAVADALERHYGNTLVAGLAAQVAFAPLFVALVIALALSILGILLIPFAAVAYVIATAGLITLGFLATAVVVGRGWRPAPAASDRARRAATLRALLVGNVVLLSPWMVAALLAAWPLAESVARGVAFAVTWVACTAGLGAALISRAGIKRARTATAQRAMASSSWQTPTPVSGVVAARRPAATPTPGKR